jgi:EmrB/QacA subfamily drug resistance transporter
VISRSSSRWGLLAAFLGSFVALLDLTIVIVALPAIQEALGADLVGAQWIVDSFALLMGAFLLSGGLLGDRLGRKRVYLIAIVVFVAGSILCAFATSIGVLIAGQAVQGLAAAVIVPGSLSLIGRAAPDPAARGRLMGVWGMVASLAVVAGPLLGGLLVDSLGWESIFWVNLPIGIVAIVCGLVGLSESADPQHASFDPAGQLLGVLALGALAYGAIEARDLADNAATVLTAAAVFVIATIAFIAVEHRVARPMLPLELFRNRQFTVVNAASIALGFGANGAFFLITLYLQQVRGNSALNAGLLLLPMTLAIVPASFFAGRLIAARGPRLPLVIGYGLVGASLAALGAIDLTNAGYWNIGILFVVCGIGQGFAIVPAPAAVLQTVPRERSGVGSAVVSTARQVGTALGFAVLGTIVATHTTGVAPADLAAAFVDGLHISLVVAAALVLLAAVGLAVVRGSTESERVDHEA